MKVFDESLPLKLLCPWFSQNTFLGPYRGDHEKNGHRQRWQNFLSGFSRNGPETANDLAGIRSMLAHKIGSLFVCDHLHPEKRKSVKIENLPFLRTVSWQFCPPFPPSLALFAAFLLLCIDTIKLDSICLLLNYCDLRKINECSTLDLLFLKGK